MKLKKLLSLALSSVMLVSATGISASAVNEAVDVDNRTAELVASGHEVIEVDAVPGNVYDMGNGLRCVVMDKEMLEDTMETNGDSVSANARSIRYAWSFPDMYGMGRSLECDLTLAAPYSHFRMYFDNYQPYYQKTTFAVYDTYGNLCSTLMNVPGEYAYYFYSIGGWTGNYYVGYYSNYELDGSTYCFRATSQPEVDYDEWY